MGLKPDAEHIKQFLNNLQKQDWVRRTERSWWPQFVFHYTDIRNAIKILKAGYLYSREHLEKTGQSFVSSGSPSVLAGTDVNTKDCVRLYFRPQTPTQYYAEGIYSKTSLARSKFPEAHCPVPVFFLFSAYEVLSQDNCQFSNGNLGASGRAQIFSTAVDLASLPWKQIYHNSRIDHSLESRDIVFHRHAEIILPKKLNLSALRYICCRSEAEREMLLHLLPVDLAKCYQNKVAATTRSTLFYRRHTFVEKAQFYSDRVVFHFSPDTQSPGPFLLRVYLGESLPESPTLEVDNYQIEGTLHLKFPLPMHTYTIRVLLDEHLAYANLYEEMNLPF
ncbi:MAG: DUF4433 domain-containing protein [Anaerolineae bacterium]|nr:DUF4433 domain-containing protein [Anaerolineae bacterium]